MNGISRGLLALSMIFLSACATSGKRAATAPANGSPLENQAIYSDDITVAPAVIEEKEVSSEAVEQNEQRPYKSSYGEINMQHNEHVQKWINYFQGRGRKHMELYLSRSGRYLPMMKNVLRENSLPEDLVYVALIESGFSPIAHSRANAVGYWQFIRATGRRYGLKVDPFIDERRDPVLSTRAAAEYFKALYGMFGDWHLSMSAYNVGENRVKRAVRNHATKDLWVLIKKRRALPPETRNYVPKFIAAALISKDPVKYGFTNVEYSDPLSYDTVVLKDTISLAKLANNLSVDVAEMKLLNPKFRSDFVPLASGVETVVRIPVGRGTDALAALSTSVVSAPKVLNAEYHFYKVRRGDNLSIIARKNRTTVSTIRRLNALSNRTVLRRGMTLKVPDQGGAGIRYVTEEDAASSKAVRAVATVGLNYHVVRRGENLTLIARRYRLSVQEIRRMNNLSNRSVIRSGQRIRIRDESSSRRADSRAKQVTALAQFSSRSSKASVNPLGRSNRTSVAGRSGSDQRPTRHLVRRGETLTELSQKYGVGLSQLAKFNKVRVNYRVMAGEKLLIPGR